MFEVIGFGGCFWWDCEVSCSVVVVEDFVVRLMSGEIFWWRWISSEMIKDYCCFDVEDVLDNCFVGFWVVSDFKYLEV